MYALRFAGYTVTTVFADVAIEEAIRRSDEAYRRGEEEYRRGRGYGGRSIPADAIRALAGPAAVDARTGSGGRPARAGLASRRTSAARWPCRAAP